MLLDPAAGTAVPVGPDLAQMLGGEPGVQQELMRFQVETATRVCTSLDDLGRELARLRRLTADAAASLGCRLVASGIAPYRTPGLAAMTDHPRYRKLARYYGQLVTGRGHLRLPRGRGVPSRDLGVQVLARLRPWLASLLAITINSPIAGGRDTAWASWRYLAWSRWPTAVPPAEWPDASAYDTAVRRLIARAAAARSRASHGSTGPIPPSSPGRSARPVTVASGTLSVTRPANPAAPRAGPAEGGGASGPAGPARQHPARPARARCRPRRRSRPGGDGSPCPAASPGKPGRGAGPCRLPARPGAVPA